MSENRIANPLRKGLRLRIPAGTPIRSMNPSDPKIKTAKRSFMITVFSVNDGWVDLWDDSRKGMGYVILPQVTWPGSGGYWQDIQLTPELCEANNIPVPQIPEVDERYHGRMDVTPSYDHCNRFVI